MTKIDYQGIVEIGQMFWGSFYDAVFLVQPDGYKQDLGSRMNEAVLNYGDNVAVRLFSASRHVSKEEIIEDVLLTVHGYTEIVHERLEGMLSEITPFEDYESKLVVGGHDLLEILRNHRGKFIILECEFRRG